MNQIEGNKHTSMYGVFCNSITLTQAISRASRPVCAARARIQYSAFVSRIRSDHKRDTSCDDKRHICRLWRLRKHLRCSYDRPKKGTPPRIPLLTTMWPLVKSHGVFLWSAHHLQVASTRERPHQQEPYPYPSKSFLPPREGQRVLL